MKKTNSNWTVVSAGPTTSSRLELFEPDLLERFPSLNVIIGKGGMGEKTLKSLGDRGVYLSYTGGAAALAADQITKVEGVFWLEKLGMAEAVWLFEVESFGPLIVGMDAFGKSLYEKR
jgi:tartrate/fumarate subfamily iron-sulfur-dependent hydro-lyase beta chain